MRFMKADIESDEMREDITLIFILVHLVLDQREQLQQKFPSR
jgi:hypothetical protein